VTKTTGSINKKVQQKMKKSLEREKRTRLNKLKNKPKTLTELEDEVERLLMKEALVLIDQEFVDRMKEIYDLCLDEEREENQEN
jgi:hypothetical protein